MNKPVRQRALEHCATFKKNIARKLHTLSIESDIYSRAHIIFFCARNIARELLFDDVVIAFIYTITMAQPYPSEAIRCAIFASSDIPQNQKDDAIRAEPDAKAKYNEDHDVTCSVLEIIIKAARLTNNIGDTQLLRPITMTDISNLDPFQNMTTLISRMITKYAPEWIPRDILIFETSAHIAPYTVPISDTHCYRICSMLVQDGGKQYVCFARHGDDKANQFYSTTGEDMLSKDIGTHVAWQTDAKHPYAGRFVFYRYELIESRTIQETIEYYRQQAKSKPVVQPAPTQIPTMLPTQFPSRVPIPAPIPTPTYAPAPAPAPAFIPISIPPAQYRQPVVSQPILPQRRHATLPVSQTSTMTDQDIVRAISSTLNKPVTLVDVIKFRNGDKSLISKLARRFRIESDIVENVFKSYIQ